jgi:hypothetical protein
MFSRTNSGRLKLLLICFEHGIGLAELLMFRARVCPPSSRTDLTTTNRLLLLAEGGGAAGIATARSVLSAD